MFFSPLLIIPVVIFLVLFVLFTALAMFLREYAFRPRAYTPDEFAMLLRNLDVGEQFVAADRLLVSNHQEPQPSVRLPRELTVSMGCAAEPERGRRGSAGGESARSR
jgi:GGDEF domain-containing protein